MSYLIFNEAGVVDINSPTTFECATTFDPEITIKNGGALNLTELEIYYQIN